MSPNQIKHERPELAAIREELRETRRLLMAAYAELKVAETYIDSHARMDLPSRHIYRETTEKIRTTLFENQHP